MNFREALNILKEKYGESAALSYTVNIYDGKEVVSICAHGDGVCSSAWSYQAAIADLEFKLHGDFPAQEPE